MLLSIRKYFVARFNNRCTNPGKEPHSGVTFLAGVLRGGQGGHLAPGPSFKEAPSSYFRLNSRNMALFCTSDPAN